MTPLVQTDLREEGWMYGDFSVYFTTGGGVGVGEISDRVVFRIDCCPLGRWVGGSFGGW